MLYIITQVVQAVMARLSPGWIYACVGVVFVTAPIPGNLLGGRFVGGSAAAAAATATTSPRTA